MEVIFEKLANDRTRNEREILEGKFLVKGLLNKLVESIQGNSYNSRVTTNGN